MRWGYSRAESVSFPRDDAIVPRARRWAATGRVRKANPIAKRALATVSQDGTRRQSG